jgi:ABC-type glycerol-3-phosphate transport system substrate-binding protein
MTLEALSSLCQRIQDFYTDRGIYCYGFALSGRESDFMRIFTLLRTFNGRFTDEQGTIAFDSPENIAGFRWLKDFIQRFRVFRSDTYTIRKRFARGDILFISDAPWVKYQLEELTGEDLERNFEVVLNPIQVNSYSASWTNNHALAICGQSRHKLYAAKFIDALTHDPEISNYYYSRVGHLPSHQQYFDDPRYDSPFYAAYKTQLCNAVCMNGQHEMFDSAVVFCLDAADKILFQNADIEQELNEKAYYLKMLYNKVPGFLSA